MAPVEVEPARSDSSLSDYCLPWLFDPDRIDHLPIEEQLKLYKERDLRAVKIFKIATQIWGAPPKRKRVMIAPPMNQAQENEYNIDLSVPRMNSQLKPQKPPVKPPSAEHLKALADAAKKKDHENWVGNRRKFRSELDNMGLNEEWLARKPNRTVLEERVLRRIIAEKNPASTPPPPPVEEPLEAVLPDETPLVKRPSPLAIHLIEQFLHEKKMRLIDLFSRVDKNKDWKVTRNEFRSAIKEAQLPISEVLLEDLILALDTDLNDELDYRELAKGMGLWRLEKREGKRKLINSNPSPSKLSQLRGFESPDKALPLPSQSSISFNEGTSPYTTPGHSAAVRATSALSCISSSSSSVKLEAPPLDVRQEQRHYSSAEAQVDQRKRDREALSRLTSAAERTRSKSTGKKHKIEEEEPMTLIKTGDEAVDAHCKPSTLGGETAEGIDRFRELKMREYHDVIQLCKENDVPLTEKLLAKALLYLPDKPHSELRGSIRQTGLHLMSNKFADPPKPKITTMEQKHKEPSFKVTSSGKILVDGKNSYPTRDTVSAVPIRMNLSTGRAYISRKVNCWMTFDEYDRLTRDLESEYSQIHGPVDSNAFWPGQLLDKLRLCMPESDKNDSLGKKPAAVFNSVKRERKIYPGYDNNLRSWPIGDSGYMQPGLIDPYKNKFI